MAGYKSLSAFLILLIGILLAGCQSMGDKKKEDAMKGTLAAYGSVLRWQDSNGLESFFKDPDMGRQSLNPGYGVASYDVLSGPNYMDETHVKQLVEIGFVHQDSQSYFKVMDDQIWESSNDGMTWLRTNPGPRLGKKKK